MEDVAQFGSSNILKSLASPLNTFEYENAHEPKLQQRCSMMNKTVRDVQISARIVWYLQKYMQKKLPGSKFLQRKWIMYNSAFWWERVVLCSTSGHKLREDTFWYSLSQI